jgi:hypothetical protein
MGTVRATYILWRIKPLLGRELKKDIQYNRCSAIGGKTNTRFYATIEGLLDCNNGNYVLCVDVIRRTV